MIFGLLGPNGSGKTTTLGMLLGVLKPSSGGFTWFGKEPSAKIRRRIGAILETPCFYPYLSATRNLRIICQIKECPEESIDQVLKVVGLYERRNDPFKTFSLGMKQRLAIASALLADPEILILDEPTNGLDPQGIVEIRNIIRKIAQTGKTIILASHLLDEVQKVCTHFMVLKKGDKLYQGNVGETLSEQHKIEVGSSNMDDLQKELQSMDGITEIDRQAKMIEFSAKDSINAEELNIYLAKKGIALNHLVEKSGNLEAQFLKILAENE
jgi:ABC-2 type transport system ATP-binding protein